VGLVPPFVYVRLRWVKTHPTLIETRVFKK
jgi:hypothetical protein